MHTDTSRSGIQISDLEVQNVAPGITRRTISTGSPVSIWYIEMQPNTEWPAVDRHDENGEHLYVLSGELIEGTDRYPAGTFVIYEPRSLHRPRTSAGVTMLGFNIVSRV